MAISDKDMQDLARVLSASMGLKPKAKAGLLHVVETHGEEFRMTAVQRDVIYGRIRDLGNLFWLNWLIRQETMHVFGVMEALSDDELMALMSKIQRAQECREEGVAFNEVPGLMKSSHADF